MNRLHRWLASSIFLAAAPLALPLNALAQNKPADKPAPLPSANPTDTKPEPVPALRGRTDVTGEDLLGGSYQNPLAGIAFRVPGMVKQVAKTGDEIARFGNEDKTVELGVSKTTSGQPLPLTGGANKMGLLEVVAARLKQSNPGVEIARQDAVNLGETQAGIIMARASVGTQRKLLQEAIVQANDQLYYTFTFTSPAAKDSTGPETTDPAEQVAMQSFHEMLDTIKLLDRASIKDEQNERLYRTRAFYATLNEARLKSILIPEQWLRLMRDGHDIGYTYVVEEEGSQGPADGIKIGIRSRSYPEQTVQVDGETWYFVSFDRKHETWRSLAWVQNLSTKASDQFTEIGSSDSRVKRVIDPTGAMLPGDKDDKKQPPTIASDVYTIDVQTIGKEKNVAPFKQDVPPWYLPQAVGQLLPRLLPLREPKTFLFAVYVSDQGKVMHRYIDVGSEQAVELVGKNVRAVPITDHIGLEGAATVHYVSEDGRYLGSVNKESKITILPTDAATLQKIWENKADLTRPRDIQPAPTAKK